MIGIELASHLSAAAVCERALARGVIALPSGNRGEVVSVTPPLCIDAETLTAALGIVLDAVRDLSTASPS
jgi:4-aminobutyrate aminotransferase-like enzyme